MSIVNYDTNGFAPLSRPDNKTRIIYVDPNDIYDDINGVPLTPDYTDYCIWCNLVVEKSSRIKNGVDGKYRNGSGEIFSISWDATASEGTQYLSFMRGKDALKYNFLTTDYTEIDFNTIKKRNIIEGLGIESINIAMNNYYVPEVTINFVDVRGAGFFAREEATHDTFDLVNLDEDEYGNTIDNFYSCFVSFPYPRFKLQIKGFYGKPVTYQLTCSNFSGEFDSNTGNFKLTAKFIGYQYSILADIPFNYIVAAPYCQYEGQAYWDSHVNSKAWQLYKENGTVPPQKLGDFYEKIYSSINDEEAFKKLMSYGQTMNLNSLSNSKTDLNILYNSFVHLIQELSYLFSSDGKGFIIDSYNNVSGEQFDTLHQQVIFFSKDPVVKLTDKVCKAYNDFVATLNQYTKTYQGSLATENNECLDNSRRPNIGEDKWEPGDINLTELLEIKNDLAYIKATGKCVTVAANNSMDASVSQIASGGSSGTLKICQELSYRMKDILISDSKIVKERAVYACILDCKRFGPIYTELLGKLMGEISDISERMEKEQEVNITNYFGFAPYVGNFYKIVMCHLETFIHIMYRVAENIDAHYQDRVPARLGVTLDATDINNISFVPPWPAIYKPNPVSSTARYENLDNAVDVRGWVGDVMGAVEWEEKRMIDALYHALSHVVNLFKPTTGSVATVTRPSILASVCPIVPSDLLHGIPKYAYTSKEKFAAYMGIRMMQIFGMFNRGKDVTTDIAEKIGKLDAYNYFKNRTTGTINRELFIQEEGKDRVEMFLDIMRCKENGRDEKYSFELTTVENDRQPIFVEENGRLRYCYMNSLNEEKDIPILPINLSDLSSLELNNYFEYTTSIGSTHRFVCKVNQTDTNDFTRLGNDSQYTGNSTDFIDYATTPYEGDYQYVKDTYINNSMFYVVDSDEDIAMIDKVYKMLNGEEDTQNKQFTILTENSQQYTDIAKKYWLNVNVPESDFYDPLQESKYNWTISLKAYNEIWHTNYTNEVEIEMYDMAAPIYKIPYVGTTVATNVQSAYNFTKTIKKVSTKNEKFNLSSIYGIYYMHSDGKLRQNCIFGSSFYYLQNGLSYLTQSTVMPHLDETTIHEDKRRAKVLLILHTFMYKFDMLKNKSYFNSNSKDNGGIEKLPYLYVLFIGGLIWRKKYVQKHNSDPIEFSNIFKKPASKYDPLLRKDGSRYYFVHSADTNPYNVKYSDIVNPNMDIAIENALVDRFLAYADLSYSDYENSLELHGIDTSNNVTRLLFYNDISVIAKTLSAAKSNSEREDYVSKLRGLKTLYGGGCRFTEDFDKKYCFISPATDSDGSNVYNPYMFGLYRLPNEEDNRVLDEIKQKKCYVLTSIHSNKTAPTVHSIPKNLATSYLNGFLNTLDRFSESSNRELVAMGSGVDETAKKERDIKIGMFIYLKNLWDKWLCGYFYSNSHITNDTGSPLIKYSFDVENYFTNFLFMDSFYRNIFKLLKLNCQKLYEAYKGGTKDYNIYSYLGTVASDHQCMFLSLPDYVNLGDNDDSVAMQNMTDMFRPMPANRVPLPQRENRFIVMYTHQPSSIATVDKSDYKPDSFDIWSENDGTYISPGTFHNISTQTSKYVPDSNLSPNEQILDAQMNRYGYNVPSFGVAYSRQNNSIFKNVKASMNNPVMTEQAILAMGAIAEMGNSSNKKVCYYGQDIYPIYSNYSYVVEIDMMGDAQIQPLMYFQLMNIPMFRGTYMIIAVTHSMSQGNMTTHIKATKMSKYATPFVSNWYTLPPAKTEKGNNGYNGGDYFDGSCKIHQEMANKLRESCSINKYKNGWYPSEEKRKVYLEKGKPKDPKQYSGYCAGYVGDAIIAAGVNLTKANACDMEPNLIKAGFVQVTDINIDKAHKDNVKAEIGKCHTGDVAIFEPCTGHKYGHAQMCIASNGGETEWASDAIQGSNEGGFWCATAFKTSVLNDNSYVKIYRYNEVCGTGSGAVAGEGSGNVELKEIKLNDAQIKHNIVWLMDYFTKHLASNSLGPNLTLHQAAAVVGNIYAESRCNPFAIEKLSGGKKGPGRGLCQWTYYTRKQLLDYDLKAQFNGNVENMMIGDNDTVLGYQARYCAWELRHRSFKEMFTMNSRYSMVKETPTDDRVRSNSILKLYASNFCKCFERPKDMSDSHMQTRANYARLAYDTYLLA